jgi:hypothetical protein
MTGISNSSEEFIPLPSLSLELSFDEALIFFLFFLALVEDELSFAFLSVSSRFGDLCFSKDLSFLAELSVVEFFSPAELSAAKLFTPADNSAGEFSPPAELSAVESLSPADLSAGDFVSSADLSAVDLFLDFLDIYVNYIYVCFKIFSLSKEY